jgi:hypothetical protein
MPDDRAAHGYDRSLEFHQVAARRALHGLHHRLPHSAAVVRNVASWYCGRIQKHEFQLYLAVNDIDRTRTRAKSPQTKRREVYLRLLVRNVQLLNKIVKRCAVKVLLLAS